MPAFPQQGKKQIATPRRSFTDSNALRCSSASRSGDQPASPGGCARICNAWMSVVISSPSAA